MRTLTPPCRGEIVEFPFGVRTVTAVEAGYRTEPIDSADGSTLRDDEGRNHFMVYFFKDNTITDAAVRNVTEARFEMTLVK